MTILSPAARLIWDSSPRRPGGGAGACRGACPGDAGGGQAAEAGRARRQPHRRLRPAAGPGVSRRAGAGAESRRAGRSRSSTPASPATPPPTASRASTGACRKTRTRSSSSSAPTTCCAAPTRRRPRSRCRTFSPRRATRIWRPCSPAWSPRRTTARTTSAASTRSIPSSRRAFGVTLYPFFLEGVAGDRPLQLERRSPSEPRRRRAHRRRHPALGRGGAGASEAVASGAAPSPRTRETAGVRGGRCLTAAANLPAPQPNLLPASGRRDRLAFRLRRRASVHHAPTRRLA